MTQVLRVSRGRGGGPGGLPTSPVWRREYRTVQRRDGAWTTCECLCECERERGGARSWGRDLPATRRTALSTGSSCRMLSGLSRAHSSRLCRSISMPHVSSGRTLERRTDGDSGQHTQPPRARPVGTELVSSTAAERVSLKTGTAQSLHGPQASHTPLESKMG